MSAMRTSFTEPFALSRSPQGRESFAEWFSGAPRVTAPSVTFELDDVPELILVRGAGELHPATAGAMAGAVAGPAMLAVANALSHKAHHALDLPVLLGRVARAPAAYAHFVGFTIAVAIGALLGALFAGFTRRLRSFAPMIAFGIVTAFATWTALHGLVLARFAPWLAKMLPYGPMVISSMVFGALLALQVPIRTRRFA